MNYRQSIIFRLVILNEKQKIPYSGNSSMVMVFNATSNNIISWRSVLLVEETAVPGENHRPAEVNDKLYHIMLYRVHLTWEEFELTTLVLIGIDCIGIIIKPTAMQSRPRLPLGTVQKSKNNCWKNGKIDTPNTYICMPSHFPVLFNNVTGLN